MVREPATSSTRMPMSSSTSSGRAETQEPDRRPGNNSLLETSSEENLDDALILFNDDDILQADDEANEQIALERRLSPRSRNMTGGGESGISDGAHNSEEMYGHVSAIDSDDAIELSGDEEPPQDQDVSLVCLKRPIPMEKNVECLDILESDEEFPVCVRPAEKVEVNVEEKKGYVKELIESEGLAVIHSEEYGLVLFHMENVWIQGEKYETAKTRDLLMVGTEVSFYDRSFEGPEYRFLCPEQILQQAVIVWTDKRPSHLLKTLEAFDDKFWKRLKEHRDTFLLYLRGEVFLHMSLVRVKGKIMGYLSPRIGIVEVIDQDNTKQNVVFHEDDVRIFKKNIHHWNRDLVEILPVGLSISLDARRIHIPGVKNLVYQAVCVFAGSWPDTPHPTLLPGGAGSYAPCFDIPPGQFSFYYLELALESRLRRKANEVKELLAKTQGHPRYEWRGVNVIRHKQDLEDWRQLFVHGKRPPRRDRDARWSKKQVTHTFKPPPVRRFKTKEEMDTGSEVATFGSTSGSVSGVGSGWSRPVSRLSCPSSDYSNTNSTGSRATLVRSWYNEETWAHGGLRIKNELKSEPGDPDGGGADEPPAAKRMKME